MKTDTIVTLVALALVIVVAVGAPWQMHLKLYEMFKYRAPILPAMLSLPIISCFLSHDTVYGVLYVALFALSIPFAIYSFYCPMKMIPNMVFVTIEFVLQTPLIVMAPQYKEFSYRVIFFYFPYAISLIEEVYFPLFIIVRASRFEYVCSKLPKDGKDFYNKYRFYLPKPYEKPELPDGEWLQLARMGILCQCRKKGIFRLELHRIIAFEEVLKEIMQNDVSTLKYPVFVKFIGEDAVDTGGLKNELFTLLSEQFFELKPTQLKLLRESSMTQFTIQEYISYVQNQNYDPINSLLINDSGGLMISQKISPPHAFMMGWLIGKCLYHNCVVPFDVSALLLAICINHIELCDVADFDPEFASFIAKSEQSNEQYACFRDLLGSVKLDSLKPRKINVADAVLLKYFPVTQKPFEQLSRGFHAAFPEPATYYLSVQILKRIFQCKEISIEDWRQHAEISHQFKDSKAPEAFFQMLELNPKLKPKVLQFATGLKNLPNGSFEYIGKPLFSGEKTQRFQLEPIPAEYLPVSSTCSYLLKIPLVETWQEMLAKFNVALACESLDNP